MLSTPSSFPPTATGSALPLPAALRSSIWKASELTVNLRFLFHTYRSIRSIVDELKPDFVEVGKDSREPECVSLAWSADGQTLFGGFTDNLVRVWTVVHG